MPERDHKQELIGGKPALAEAVDPRSSLDTRQAARYLKITVRLMRRLADEGIVPYVVVAGRRGRRWRLFLPSELDRVLEEVPARSA